MNNANLLGQLNVPIVVGSGDLLASVERRGTNIKEDGLWPMKRNIPRLAFEVEMKLRRESDRAASHGTSGKVPPTEK